MNPKAFFCFEFLYRLFPGILTRKCCRTVIIVVYFEDTSLLKHLQLNTIDHLENKMSENSKI